MVITFMVGRPRPIYQVLYSQSYGRPASSLSDKVQVNEKILYRLNGDHFKVTNKDTVYL